MKHPAKKSPFNYELQKDSEFLDYKGDVLINKTNIVDIFEYYSSKPNGEQDVLSQRNQKEFRRSLYSIDDKEWRGGSFDSLFQEKSLSKVIKYENEVFKSFSTSFCDLQVRKRIRSEYDGDFDYDKRYDIAPFSRRGLGSAKRKSIKIFGEVSFSGFADSDTIDAYGSFIVALVNHFEKLGVNVDLYLTRTCTGSGDGRNFLDRTITKVKSPGAYLPKKEMLKVFNSVYFRRIGFTQIIKGCDYMGQDVSGGYGIPFKFGVPFKYDTKENELHIYNNPDFKAQKDIVQILEKELLNKNENT